MDNLKALKGFFPSEIEIVSLRKYRGDKSDLSKAALYFFMLIDVDDYILRIEMEIAKIAIDEKLTDYLTAVENYQKACKG